MHTKKNIKQRIKKLKKEGFSSKHNFAVAIAKDLKKILMDHEEVLAILDVDTSITSANRWRKYLVLTNKRIIFIRRGMWLGYILFFLFHKTESIKISDILDITATPLYEYKAEENVIAGDLKIVYKNQEIKYRYGFHKVALQMVGLVKNINASLDGRA